MKRELSVASVILALAACGNAASAVSRFSAGRIVGGKATTIEAHPFQVSLVYFNYHRCGGSIINENYVITAAHCVNSLYDYELRFLKIRAGSSYLESGGTLHEISRCKYHSYFSESHYDYDIALIKVKQPFEFGSTIQPIELPPAGYTLPVGTVVSISGWGRLTSDGNLPSVLQVVEVPIIDRTYCGNLYSYLNVITERMICAGYEKGGKDACQGDSGGPLFLGNTLVGLVSWGDGCAVAYQPGVYTNVSNLLHWVFEETGQDFF